MMRISLNNRLRRIRLYSTEYEKHTFLRELVRDKKGGGYAPYTYSSISIYIYLYRIFILLIMVFIVEIILGLEMEFHFLQLILQMEIL